MSCLSLRPEDSPLDGPPVPKVVVAADRVELEGVGGALVQTEEAAAVGDNLSPEERTGPVQVHQVQRVRPERPADSRLQPQVVGEAQRVVRPDRKVRVTGQERGSI